MFVNAPDAILSSSKDGSGSGGSGGGTTTVSGPYKHELNQSPLLFRESAASPDQEERIRRKDAIIQTRNAQVAALWDELHTRQPWRNAVGSGKPVQPFPAEAEAEAGARAAAGNNTGLLLYVGINTVGVRCCRALPAGCCLPHMGSAAAAAAAATAAATAAAAAAAAATCCLLLFQRCAVLCLPACMHASMHASSPSHTSRPRRSSLLQGLTSRKRRDLLRKTWVPSAGGGLAGLESRLGVRIRFFVGYSQQKGDAVERELAAEMREHGDMERLEVVDEYNELSRKTARLFSQMSTSVHADFYFKIDDDVGGWAAVLLLLLCTALYCCALLLRTACALLLFFGAAVCCVCLRAHHLHP